MCQLSLAAGPDLVAIIEVQAEGHLCGCVSSTETPLVNANHVVRPKVPGGGGRGSAEDTDTRRGEELGPWLQSVALGVWGIGGLGCGEAADEATEVIGKELVEKDRRGQREMARRLLQPGEKTWAWTTAIAVGLEEIYYATFVL